MLTSNEFTLVLGGREIDRALIKQQGREMLCYVSRVLLHQGGEIAVFKDNVHVPPEEKEHVKRSDFVNVSDRPPYSPDQYWLPSFQAVYQFLSWAHETEFYRRGSINERKAINTLAYAVYEWVFPCGVFDRPTSGVSFADRTLIRVMLEKTEWSSILVGGKKESIKALAHASAYIPGPHRRFNGVAAVNSFSLNPRQAAAEHLADVANLHARLISLINETTQDMGVRSAFFMSGV
ncbi:hypothetical protein CYLTODRAFT_425804 [Cylindrobasidium torrendii FP15055 ss-10]|uniref:Uncharacterized protein n=1 Tax=Cylindrobasidium torrendii FP15055 ss-10 TaxID=1314674 RepID=A0A0D7B0V0_9AGAR|nr:hypothetical protein CYLTODRAFT_425804 [Cylindrobasidium torrendii FP15055 ss-10]